MNVKKFLFVLILGALCTGIHSVPIVSDAKETETAKDEADADAVYGTDIKDGSYEVTVDSSSSMFRIVKAQLNVADGSMTADITLSGKGYLKLFMGTGEEALAAEEESYISYVEDAEGAYVYTIPVEALNTEFACAAYSKKKETWYDRQLMIPASSLPEEALLIELAEETDNEMENAMEQAAETESEEPAKTVNSEWHPVDMQTGDGSYTMEVTLGGGSGKATVVSPARVSVSQGTVTAFIEWSSPNYDYMFVNGTQYFPVNTDGNSVFEIPVLALDEEIAIVADTVAMSKPHEITYTLTFHADTLKQAEEGTGNFMIIVMTAVIGIAAVAAVILVIIGKKKERFS